MVEVEGRPLSARSLALSVLLGTHPPELPAYALVALGELFDIEPGTMRTALSRLVSEGTLATTDGRYRLIDAELLDRQRAQDIGRVPVHHGWSGGWHTVIAADSRRPLRQRRAFRTLMANHRFGELQPDIWMRPDNEPAPPIERHHNLIVMTGSLGGREPADLVDELWDLARIGSDGAERFSHCQAALDELDWSSPDCIRPSFFEAASTLRLLRREPRLPLDLQPPDWPMDAVRECYRELETRHQTAIRHFLSRHTKAGARS